MPFRPQNGSVLQVPSISLFSEGETETQRGEGPTQGHTARKRWGPLKPSYLAVAPTRLTVLPSSSRLWGCLWRTLSQTLPPSRPSSLTTEQSSFPAWVPPALALSHAHGARPRPVSLPAAACHTPSTAQLEQVRRCLLHEDLHGTLLSLTSSRTILITWRVFTHVVFFMGVPPLTPWRNTLEGWKGVQPRADSQ